MAKSPLTFYPCLDFFFFKSLSPHRSASRSIVELDVGSVELEADKKITALDSLDEVCFRDIIWLGHTTLLSDRCLELVDTVHGLCAMNHSVAI